MFDWTEMNLPEYAKHFCFETVMDITVVHASCTSTELYFSARLRCEHFSRFLKYFSIDVQRLPFIEQMVIQYLKTYLISWGFDTKAFGMILIFFTDLTKIRIPMTIYFS